MSKSKKNTEIALAQQQDNSALIQRPDAATIADKLSKGKMVAQILELDVGEAFEGVVVGPGQVIPSEKKDAAGDPVKSEIHTIRMRHESGVEVDIMQDYTLKKDLLPLVGRIAWIQRQEQKNIGARRVNQWAVVDMGPEPVQA